MPLFLEVNKGIALLTSSMGVHKNADSQAPLRTAEFKSAFKKMLRSLADVAQ